MCGGKKSSPAPAPAPTTAPEPTVLNVTDYSTLQTRARAPQNQSSTMDQVTPATDTGSSYGSTLTS